MIIMGMIQGGFAKCYEFTSLETKKLSAAKVVPKASLSKSRAKQKVRINSEYQHYS